jgi:hypothetical protein
MRYLLPFLLVICVSCDEGEEPPEGIMEREVFKSILVDVHLIEARTGHDVVLDQQALEPLPDQYQQLFSSQGTDREQFRETFQYYSARPEQLKEIYEEVLVELIRRKDLPPEPEVVIDTTTVPLQDTVVTAVQPES